MRPFSVAAIAFLVMAGCAAPTEDASPAPAPSSEPAGRLATFEYTGADCTEISFGISIPASNVRALVPSKYRLTGEAQGRAIASIDASKCDTTRGVGEPRTGVIQSNVGVYIDNPPSGSGPAPFFLWLVYSDGRLVDNLTRVGLPTGHAPKASLLSFSLAASQQYQTRIPWDATAYTLNATGSSTTGGSAPAPITWWFEDANGTIRMDFQVAARGGGPAHGDVSTSAGSRLARILGAPRTDSPAVILLGDVTLAKAQRL